jgi:predicted 2-oxoglutarate/Fe(II)-dependent dioxygenase YbiX
MREIFRERVRLGQRTVRFRKEAEGIVALPLFRPLRCVAMIEAAKGLVAEWETAKVGRRGADGEVHSVVDPDYRTASVLFTEHLSAICPEFDDLMNSLLKPLVAHLWGKQLTGHEGTQLVRYPAGGHYRAHSDVGRRTRNRRYTLLCYLNDDFAGGSTRFPALDYSVTPACGKAILFPSIYQHGGEAVTSGEKYILVSWITGAIPEAASV